MRTMLGSLADARRPPPGGRALLLCALSWAAAGLPAQESAIVVTVLDERTGEIQPDLGPERFDVQDGDLPLRVLAADPLRGPVDVLLLVDASMAGHEARAYADAMVAELPEGVSMAVVGFNDSAELLQDFTSDQDHLRRALGRLAFEALPRLLDALVASLEDGFRFSPNRKAVVVISSGAVAASRVSEAEVLEAARAKGVPIHAVFVRNAARAQLRRLALRTGGGAFAAKRLKLDPRGLAEKVLAAVANPYQLTVSGVFALGSDIRVEVSRVAGQGKLTASALPVD